MMKDLGIGVIGAWGRGKLALNAHKPGEGSRLIAGADVNPQALEKLKEKIGSDLFVTADYRELLKRDDIDAVFVTSPDFLHEEHGVAALEAGKAVYLEKPMAITIDGCDRLLETACRTGSKLYLGHNMRHFPMVLKMKEIIDSGRIGKIQSAWCRHFVAYGGDAYFKDWHSEQRYSTGLLLQKGAHDIDVMHWLCGGYTRRVVGMGRLSVYDKCTRRNPEMPGNVSWSDANWPPETQTEMSPVIDVEDHNMILMQLDNGVQMSYVQCHYTPDAERNYTFIGTRGRVENIGDSGKCEIHVWTQRGPRQTPDIIYKLKEIPGSHGGSDPEIVDTFIKFVREGVKTNTSPVAARNAVAAGVLGHQSMRHGNAPQDVPELPPYLLDYFAGGQRKK
ncbi:MAG: Gfo/Idh/MocA family oxidoreductase [Victivallaceae bacterium]|nr:Gfo/Idh/MocA family oxidoreductase [Victivallaceae bacterium]